jgi:hypothetical protein
MRAAAVVRYRQLLGLWTFAFLLPRLPWLASLYCRPVLRGDVLEWLGLGPPPPAAVAGLFAVCLGALLAVTAGWRSRAAWLVFYPCFALILALDPFSARGYGTLALVQWGLLWFAPFDADPEAEVAAWPAQLLVLQWASVYVLSVGAKLSEPGWQTGTALFRALNSDEQGRWLLSADGVSQEVAFALSVATIVAEVGIGVGVWFPRTRWLAALACLGLHAGILASMRISPLFALVMWLHLPLALALPTGRSSGILARCGGPSLPWPLRETPRPSPRSGLDSIR